MCSEIITKQNSSMPRRIIVIRNTPDWEENSKLWKKTGRVDPSRFLPSPLPPGFPEDTVELILSWNRIFNDDFFLVRETIKNMALNCFKAMKPDKIIAQREFEVDPVFWANNSIIFFTDDDDFARHDLFDVVSPYLKERTCVRWPSPVLREKLVNRRVEKSLPFFRLWVQRQVRRHPVKLKFLQKLVKGRHNLPRSENRVSDFILQTNNYAMNLSGLTEEEIVRCVDHVKASRIIRSYGIKLISLETNYLSFTNKLPSSITKLRTIQRVSKNDEVFKELFKEYIHSFSRVTLPDELVWAKKYQRQLSSYFNLL